MTWMSITNVIIVVVCRLHGAIRNTICPLKYECHNYKTDMDISSNHNTALERPLRCGKLHRHDDLSIAMSDWYLRNILMVLNTVCIKFPNNRCQPTQYFSYGGLSTLADVALAWVAMPSVTIVPCLFGDIWEQRDYLQTNYVIVPVS